MRRTCWSSTAGSLSLPLMPSSSSSSSGIVFQRKNDSFDASSRSLIGVGVAGAQPRGDALAPVEEERARQQAGDGAADAALEAAVLHAVLVVGEKLVHVLVGHRPPVGALGQRRDDLSWRSRLRAPSPSSRMADEDALATRRRSEPLRVERALKLERIDAIQPILSAAGREHLQLIVGLGERPALERHADPVRPAGREEADVLQAGVDPIERAVHAPDRRASCLLRRRSPSRRRSCCRASPPAGSRTPCRCPRCGWPCRRR